MRGCSAGGCPAGGPGTALEISFEGMALGSAKDASTIPPDCCGSGCGGAAEVALCGVALSASLASAMVAWPPLPGDGRDGGTSRLPLMPTTAASLDIDVVDIGGGRTGSRGAAESRAGGF